MTQYLVPNTSLTDIGDEFRLLLTRIAQEQEGQITPEQEALLADIMIKTTDKVTKYSNVLRNLEAEAKEARARAKEVVDYAIKLENMAEKLENVAIKTMLKMDVKKLNGQYGTSLSLRTSTRVEVACDPIDLDIKFIRTKLEADKTLIKEALSKGESVPGCLLIENVSLTWK